MSDAGSWDDRYRTAEFVWKTDPNRFFPPEVAGSGADGTQWESEPDDLYDLVVVFSLHLPETDRRFAFGTATRALAPGGTLLIVGHDLINLTEGTGGPQNPAVLYTPDDVCADLHASRVTDLVIDRRERVERPVDTDAGQVTAIDCLVRAHRPAGP